MMGGVHGLDRWLETLRDLLTAEPEPGSLDEALAPLAQIGVDVPAVRAAAQRRLNAPAAAWHPDDWRHSHPDFPLKYALAIHVFTLQSPNLYTPLGASLHGIDRDAGPGGVNENVRACMPYARLLDAALEEALLVWGPFVGQTFRGVKYAFPKPTVAEHDPVAYFPLGRELHWYEFNSSSTEFEVMYREWFCGKRGPRNIFTIRSCEGVSIRMFSDLPDEHEVLFRLFAHFRVTHSAKKLRAADLGPNPPADGGFPDDVHLQQLPTDLTKQLEAMRRRLQAVLAERQDLERAVQAARAGEEAARIRLAEELQQRQVAEEALHQRDREVQALRGDQGELQAARQAKQDVDLCLQQREEQLCVERAERAHREDELKAALAKEKQFAEQQQQLGNDNAMEQALAEIERYACTHKHTFRACMHVHKHRETSDAH